MIFVTGGTGMVGGEIVRLLSQNGTAARALVRNPKNAKNLPAITWVTGDLAKPETFTCGIRRCQNAVSYFKH